MLQDLPISVFQTLIEQHLTDLDTKTMRLVNKGWNSCMNNTITALEPREFSRSQDLGMLIVFKNLESLVLRHHTHAALEDFKSGYQQLTALTKLTSLHLHLVERYDNPTLIQGIEGLPDMSEALQYEHAKAVTDEALEALSCLGNLRELSLSGAVSIVGKGLATLKDLPHFRSLGISRCGRISSEGLRAMAGLTQLTALDASYVCHDPRICPPHASLMREGAVVFLDVLPSLTGLQSLDLYHCVEASEDLLGRLAGLSRLTALQLGAKRQQPVPAIEGSALLNLRNLKVLGVRDWHIYLLPSAIPFGSSWPAELALTELATSTWLHEEHDVLLHAVIRGGRLKVLELKGHDQTVSDITHLWTQATKLTCLRFHGCTVASPEELQTLTLLKSLTFGQRCRISCDEVRQHVGTMGTLETLHFVMPDFDAYDTYGDVPLAAALEDLGALQTLSISMPANAHDATVASLGQLTTLKALDLPTYEAVHGLSPLSALTRLTFLSVGFIGRQGSGLDAIRHLKSLRSLSLYRGRFTDEGLRMLTGLTALRSLSLARCHEITDNGFKDLVVPLSQHFLAWVDVEGCKKLTALSSAESMGVMWCTVRGLNLRSLCEKILA